MVTRMAPAFANLFMGNFEEKKDLEAFQTKFCFGLAKLTTYLWFGHIEMKSMIVLLLT